MTCLPRKYISASPYNRARRSRMSLEPALGNSTCSKGHVHPPWNTIGILRIAKCETICGFCQKETKTAANLRKHVAIHIKNERLNLAIAEGSSGRGRLEIPSASLDMDTSSTSSRVSVIDDDENSRHKELSQPPVLNSRPRDYHVAPSADSFSPSAALIALHHSSASQSSSTSAIATFQNPAVVNFSQEEVILSHLAQPFPSSDVSRAFQHLRQYNIGTKSAWTVIPASEGFRILDLCKSMSVSNSSASSSTPPCYNRETIFDEEWQAHMKDVHGVFLLWPETWVRRIEILDLEAFGGDIGVCNDVLMET